MHPTSLKEAVIHHTLVLCVGPAMVILAGLLGAGYFDDFTHSYSSFGGLLSFGTMLLIAVPIVIVPLGIILAIKRRKETLKWLWLPVVTLIFSLVMFPFSIYSSIGLESFSDCQLTKEDNPVKCGYR